MSQLRWLLVIVLAGGVFSPTSQVASAQESRPPAPKKLLIVAPNSFHGALKPFVEHKKHLLPAEVVSLETVLKNTKGADDAEKLKRYLYDRWKKDQIGYVLLVGDAEVMPVRYHAINYGDSKPPTAGWAFAPCDLYYGDLAKTDGSFGDWNAKKDGFHAQYYGEAQHAPEGFEGANVFNPDQVKYLPDIAVGRWPVHTVAQVETVAAKTIRYENHILANDLSYIRRNVFVNGPDLEDFRDLMNDWASRLNPASKAQTVRLYYKDETRDDKTPPPNEEEIVKALNAGVGMVFHIGHGDPDSWYRGIACATLPKLKNAELPPLVFSLGCTTSLYAPIAPMMPYVDVHGKSHPGTDSTKEVFTLPPPPPNNYQRGKFDLSSLGVEAVRADTNGAVAYLGWCAGNSTRNIPMMTGFVNYIALHNDPRLGDAWMGAVANLYYSFGLGEPTATDSGRCSAFDGGMSLQVFGDPSLLLPRKPKKDGNLLVNGSFEDGIDVKGEHKEVKAGSTDIKGWKVINSVLILGGWEHVDGKQCLLLHGPDKRGGVEQTFKTTKGQRYRVSFDLSANPNNGRWPPEMTTATIEVSAAGQTKQFSFDCTGKMPYNMGWTTKEWEFEAADVQTTLAFSAAEVRGNYWHGPALDNVRVVVVPGGKK